jgi:hypothetical protein
MNYVGHGGVDRFASGGLLTVSDVDGMTNTKLPVLVAMTCSAGQFAIPGYDSLGEALVVKKGAGAVAMWGPSGLSIDSFAVLLDKGFFSRVFTGGAILGDMIIKADKDYNSKGGSAYIMDIYNLLGDPALKLW